MDRLSWTESEPPGPLAPGQPCFSATATAPDGAVLELQVFGERPRPWSRLHLGLQVRPAPSSWLLVSTLRPPGLLEILEAVNVAGRRLPEWWAVLLPWSLDLDPSPPGVTPEAYYARGVFMGPVPVGTRVVAALELGSDAAPGKGVARG